MVGRSNQVLWSSAIESVRNRVDWGINLIDRGLAGEWVTSDAVTEAGVALLSMPKADEAEETSGSLVAEPCALPFAVVEVEGTAPDDALLAMELEGVSLAPWTSSRRIALIALW